MTTVEVGPIRMKKITKQNTGVRTVRITGKVFRGNFTTPHVFQSKTNTFWGMSLFYWILMASIAGAVLVLLIIAGICGYKLSRKTGTTGTPGFVLNDIEINPGGKFRLGSYRRKKNNARRLEDNTTSLEDDTARFEEITDQKKEPTRFKELEGRLSIGEQKALAAKSIE